jgi:LytS/YehU family sensor histidine kinase
MRKATLFLATALLCSPTLFAQESSSTPAQSSTTQSSTTATTKTTKTKLTADQKSELKTLHEKVRTECKTDKTSDACKQAKSDLKSKQQEYGMTSHHMMKHKKGAASTTNPS